MLRTLNLTGDDELRRNHLDLTFREVYGNCLVYTDSKLFFKNF